MQVVSGPIGRREVHFEAPPAPRPEAGMARFLEWFELSAQGDRLMHAGLAHLWFATLHPFDDGNGRIARAVGDMALARADRSAQRFYSLSAQIERKRKDYDEMLERTQKGSMDVTPWLAWFRGCLLRAVEGAQASLSAVLAKSSAWQRWGELPLNERQIKPLNRLRDGFEGKPTSSKWAAIARSCADTALRDIGDLVARGVLKKSGSGGRSTSYELVTPS